MTMCAGTLAARPMSTREGSSNIQINRPRSSSRCKVVTNQSLAAQSAQPAPKRPTVAYAIKKSDTKSTRHLKASASHVLSDRKRATMRTRGEKIQPQLKKRINPKSISSHLFINLKLTSGKAELVKKVNDRFLMTNAINCLINANSNQINICIFNCLDFGVYHQSSVIITFS